MHVTLITGPMFSGKTVKLVGKIEKYVIAKKHILWIEPRMDDRGGSHMNLMTLRMTELKNSEYVHCHQVERPEEIFEILADSKEMPECIFIDEYFMLPFDKDFFFDYMSSQYREIPLVLAGLIATSNSDLFASSAIVLPFVDEIIKDVAICMECGKPAQYSYCAKQESEISVDHGQYICLCSDCYTRHKMDEDE